MSVKQQKASRAPWLAHGCEHGMPELSQIKTIVSVMMEDQSFHPEMHRAETGTRLYIYPPNLDVNETNNPIAAGFSLLESTRTMFKDVFERKNVPPPSLADHTPVNYTSPTEKAAIAPHLP